MAAALLFIYIFPGNSAWLFYLLAAGWVVAWLFTYKKTRQKLLFILSLIGFILLLWFVVHLTFVQNFIVKKVASTLSQKLHTKVAVKHVDFALFNKMKIQGVFVQDLQKDTLLYAGEMNVRITDWFFLRDKASIEYVQLNDASINLKRGADSVWNYQFIADFFASPKDTSSKKSGIEFDVKILEINNLSLKQLDGWAGKNLLVKAKKVSLDAEQLNFSNKNVLINSIALDEPMFGEYIYAGKKPADIPAVADTGGIASKAEPDNDKWVINIKNFHISKGQYIHEKQTERLPYTDRFDGQHLLFTAINGDLKNIHFQNDTLTSNINLSLKEKSGLHIKKLQADLKFTPSKMEFNNLDLLLNNSHLRNYYAMGYNDFNEDMSNFLHGVSLEGRFENSTINSNDLALFAPALKTWNRVFDINGNASGTIDNLVAKKMVIKSGGTIVDGDIALRGLPDLKQTFIDFKGNNVQTNYSDLTALFPSLKNVKGIRLDRLGNVKYKGNFTGFINDFVTYGTFNTSLGTVTGDLNMKLPQGRPAQYSGKISTGGFNLGQFVNNSKLGNIAVDGKIIGTGFTEKDLRANFEGSARSFYFSGTDYQNITINASFENKQFKGSGSINDPNLKVDNLNGTINFNKAAPEFNFDATVAAADLKKLKLTRDSFQLTGHFNLNFTGSDIDNFLGSAKVYAATLKHGSKKLSFDSLTLQTMLLPGNRKELTLKSNEADVTVTGNFKILELPDAFSYFLSNYYPAYIKKPTRILSKQDFDFSINTKNVNEYIQLLDKKLKGFDNSSIKGSLNLTSNELSLDAEVPEFKYADKTFLGIHLKGTGTADSLFAEMQTGDISISDSLHFPGARLNFTSHRDSTLVSIKTSASKTLSQAELNAQVITYNDGVKFHFFPSSFFINDKKWQLEKDGELVVRNSVFDASEVKFVQDRQEIVISTEPSGNTNSTSTDILVSLKKVNINDATSLLHFKNPRIEGELNGVLRITDPFSDKRAFEFENGTVDNLVMNDRPLGNVSIKDLNFSKDNILRLKMASDTGVAIFSIDASINLNDSVTGNKFDVAFTSEKLNLNILEPYLGSIFSNMEGNALSDLKISGSSSNQNITGNVTVTNGSFKVNYTQCKYRFSNETIIFNPGEIDFGTMTLRDTLNNEATVSGKLQHQLFKDFYFDNIHLQTGRMLLLNTSKRDNSQFYGKILGNATLDMNGPISNLRMNIDGGPSTLLSDNNHLYLPTGSSRDVGSIDYIEFVPFGSIMENELSTKEGTNILVEMDLTANPACKVDVILDESTGDIIKGEGNGKLHLRVGNKEALSIRGTYFIERGQYTFNFQQFVNKGFTLKRGGYISWNKPDPYDADISIDAEYLAPSVDFSSLLPTNKSKSGVNIVAHLTNTLKSPRINFEFEVPANSIYAQDIIVKSKLNDFTRDENEMNKQVSSILIFNRFLAQNQSFFENQAPTGIVINTIGQILSQNLTALVNKFLAAVGVTFNFDVSSSNDLNGVSKNLQLASNIAFSKQILDGRIIISVGGNVDVNNPYVSAYRNSNSSLLVTPDFTAEFLLTKDGKLRVIAFRRTNTDFTLGQQNRQGISLNYRNDFDKFWELFQRKKAKK